MGRVKRTDSGEPRTRQVLMAASARRRLMIGETSWSLADTAAELGSGIGARYISCMGRSKSVEGGKRRRDRMRAAGLRPVQIWIPDTRAPGFAEEYRRQCQRIAASDATDTSRAEAAFWERASADAWDALG
jgi:Protein  of unknown function (DUF3018)